MEKVLDVYMRPYDSRFPVVCMDESPRQLIGEVKAPIAASPGRGQRHDYEYKRLGTCNVFMANEPLAGKRRVEVTERKTKTDWALFAKSISEDYPEAEKITLVMDNFATHNASAFYEAFEPEQAKRLWDRFDFVFTPKHGSWLNMAEIELNVLIGQCLNRRITRLETVRSEVQAWQKQRDSLKASINWRFTNEEARIKLKRIYPTFDE